MLPTRSKFKFYGIKDILAICMKTGNKIFKNSKWATYQSRKVHLQNTKKPHKTQYVTLYSDFNIFPYYINNINKGYGIFVQKVRERLVMWCLIQETEILVRFRSILNALKFQILEYDITWKISFEYFLRQNFVPSVMI